jgi:hypothetical protein
MKRRVKQTLSTLKKRPKLLRLGGIVIGGIVVLLISLALFIKYNTAAAAEFTDNYLRPILGPDIVIGMEKIFYNASDKLEQVTYKSSSNGMQFVDQTNTANMSGSRLDLSPIPVNSVFTPEPKEGIWSNRRLNVFPNQEVMAYTYVRPDPDRPYAYVTIVQFDGKAVHLSAVAGTKQPGGPVGKAGPGVIPQNVVQSGNLVAAFDGGFQYRDGQYGMIVGDTTYLPLQNDLGTLVGYTDGRLQILDYVGQSLGPNVEFVRQNCPILIENGTISLNDPKNRKLWGRTLTSSIFTWRSGIGITASGNILYAVGNNLTPDSLATALKMAGAVNAMQLDINPYWVRFNIFDSVGGGLYKTSTLIKDLHDGSTQYLQGYTKDFFYVYKPLM